MKPWHDCPVCPSCQTPTGSSDPDETGRPLPRPWIECKACGDRWKGTPAERAQAERADAAWEAEQLREKREETRARKEQLAREWLARAGSAARPAPEPRPEDPTAQLPLPGVRL